MPEPLFLIELNELNFKLVERYAARGDLPAFARLLDRHGFVQTTSETLHHELEPWIQWVTAHTGKSFAEHGVFRLGDFVNNETDQIWEVLERAGLKVGAVSPMNASNRMRNPAFFVPDPWTETAIEGPPLVRRLYKAISQAVNENAQARMTPSSLFWLAAGAAAYARPGNYLRYLRLAARAVKEPWMRAIFLDLLMSDLFIGLSRRNRVDFASLFLNGAAHIQHHYLHSSTVAGTEQRNPEWYCGPGKDPLLDVYKTYDHILADIQGAFPKARLMIATGLHQEPVQDIVYYWRLKNHAAFLAKVGIQPASVAPRMSRDFLVEFATPQEALAAQDRLARVRDLEGGPMFEIDNRGASLFATLAYASNITAEFTCLIDNQTYAGFHEDVAFVAIKNGDHDGAGYFLDTGLDEPAPASAFPLKALPDRIRQALSFAHAA